MIHYYNDVKTSAIICGAKIPTSQENPAGIDITYHFRNTTCPECITKTFNNHDIVSYAWGSMIAGGVQKRCGKAHCVITYRLRNRPDYNEWEHETLCGIYETCGNWEYSNKEWFEGVDGCKKCQNIYKKLKKFTK